MVDHSVSDVKRRWWIAALLAVLFPYVGYIYLGRLWRAVAAGLFFALSSYVSYGGFGGLAATPGVLPFLYGLEIVAAAIFLIDSVLIAVRSRYYATQRYNLWWVYLGLATVGSGVVVAAGLFSSVHTFSIPASSMMPALLVGDHIVVDLKAYEVQEPSRGDVVIFYLPYTDSWGVKRLVGMPGDRVEMIDGVFHLDGEPAEREKADDCSIVDPQISRACFRETLPSGISYKILDLDQDSSLDNTEIFEIPPGHYYMLGDNRDRTDDSRFERFGPVPRGNIVGKATGILWSRSPSRIGTSIE